MVSHGLGLSFVGFRLYKALDELGRRGLFPEGPCTQIVYTLAPMYLYREHFKAEAYAVWVQGPLGLGNWELYCGDSYHAAGNCLAMSSLSGCPRLKLNYVLRPDFHEPSKPSSP